MVPVSDRRRITIEQILRRPTRPADVARTLRRLLAELPRPGRTGAVLIALTGAEVLAQVAVALLGKHLLDGALAARAHLDGRWLAAAFAAAGVFFVVVRGRYAAQESIALAWRERCVGRLSRNITAGEYEDLTAVPMAALREIIMTDAPFLTRYFVETTGQAVVLGLWVLAAAVVLAWLSPLLLVLVAGLMGVFGGAMAYGLARHLRLTGERFRRLADLSQRGRDVAEVERVVLSRQFGLGQRFVRLFMKAHGLFAAITLRQARLTASVRATVLLLNALGFLGVVTLGGYLVVRQTLDASALLAALFVVGQMLGAAAQLGNLAGRSAEAATAGQRVAAYWHGSADPRPRRDPPSSVRSIEARDLTFAYANHEPVLRDVNLALRRGRIVALTAATGAGKSTFALLVSGLLRPTEGRLNVNGCDEEAPRDLPPGRVLYVGTRPIMVEGSVRDNLFGGDARASVVQPIWEALSQTGEDAGLDKPIIDPSGAGVSSGQAQLIQLARAVLREPEVVIFDEATSSLDMRTERQVQAALLEWCRARLCLVISHRPCPWVDQADEHVRW